MIKMLASLAEDEWQRPSRCDLWSVHEVVRHVVDVCRIHIARLRHDPPVFPSGEPFEGRRAPQQWLQDSEGQTQRETLTALQQVVAVESEALDHRIREGGDDVEDGPYGPMHWTLFTTHVFWDAWLHERDVVVPLGREQGSASAEERLAALYGLFIAATPPAMVGRWIRASIEFNGQEPMRFSVFSSPDAITVRLGAEIVPVDIRANLLTALDSLAGRGAEPNVALHGPPGVIEALSWLREFMIPPTSEQI